MQNHKTIAKQLKQELQGFQFLNAKTLMKELEIILQTNIAADETRLENNEKLTCIETNEDIKRIIFEAEFEIQLRTRPNIGWKPLNIYLDDKRSTPDGYVRAFWPSQVITLIEEFEIDEISLDHDLGDDEIGTGNDVVLYIEEKIYFNRNWSLPTLKTHTDNSSARDKMQRGIKQIKNLKNVK